jgi:predicted metal-dependent peptidase
MKLNPQDRVSAARIRLLQQAPFYGLLANRWTLQADPKTPDVWVDGRTLGYNPEWVNKASFDALMSAIAHSAHHVALLHHLRRGGRDEKAWNTACDVPVNAALVAGGFVLPDDVTVAPGDEAKAAEECYSYDDPPDNDNKKPKSGGDDQPGPGEVRDQPGKNGGQMDASEQEQEITAALQDIASIAQQAKASGFGLPASIEAQLHDLLYPQADWRELLRDYMAAAAKSDYSWSRPNRRFIASGLYLPSLHSENELGDIVIAVDTSISINLKKLEQFGGAINELLEDLNPQSVTVIYCDRAIHRVDTFGIDEYPIEFHPIGRGCTSLCPPFEYVEENGLEPAVFLYFTDLGGRSPEKEPPYPVLWIDQNGDPRMMDIYRHKWGTYIPM